MRINSIQRHASAHSFSQGKVGRCHSEHSAIGSCQVRRIGKSSTVSRYAHTGASHQVAAGPLQTQPENIRPERNSHRLGKNVHEARLRQARNASQPFQRKIISHAKLLAQVLKYKSYTRVDPHGTATTKEFRYNPSLDACSGRCPSQGYAPADDLGFRDAGDAALDSFSECRSQFTFGVNKSDQYGCVSRIHFVDRIWPN